MSLLRRLNSWLYGYDAELPVRLDVITEIVSEAESSPNVGHTLVSSAAFVTWFVLTAGAVFFSVYFGLSWGWFIVVIVLSLILFIAASIVSAQMYYRTSVRIGLRDQGYDVCLGCGYWLRGLDASTERCPECGRTIATERAAPTQSIDSTLP